MQGVKRLRQLDAFPKINEDFYSRTLSGGIITIVSSVLMLALFITELNYYLHPEQETQLLVDTSRGETLNIHDELESKSQISVGCKFFQVASGHVLTEVPGSPDDFLIATCCPQESLEFTVARRRIEVSVGSKLEKTGNDYLNVAFQLDVTFPALACSVVSLDAMDISGEQHLDVKHDIFKKRLDQAGHVIEPPKPDAVNQPRIEKPLQKHGGRLDANETYCGSCFGAESADDECCNNCEEVREAYRRKGWALTNPDLVDQCKREGFLQKIKEEDGEGCQVFGTLDVNKVAGNFHFAPGKSFQQASLHVHDLQAFHKDSFNVSHRINSLSFGEHFPGKVNPLDGVERTQESMNSMYQYFIKVVPTMYADLTTKKILTNQFSVTEHVKGPEAGTGRSLPGVFFFYDLSPIKVNFTHERTSFLHFLTNLCAIIGGIFTVSGIIDAVVYHGHKAIKKKIEIGKLS